MIFANIMINTASMSYNILIPETNHLYVKKKITPINHYLVSVCVNTPLHTLHRNSCLSIHSNTCKQRRDRGVVEVSVLLW